jgi:lipopolysaccharide/colanic/teichoic acid biosynthesis glycosyltransferase
MLKFRKMCHGATGPSLTWRDDMRFTPIGRFLTLTKLDELPQVWNVLKGDMRLVGPRPEVEEFVRAHRDQYEEILSVVPGLTGLAQLEYAGENRMYRDAHDSARLYTEEILPSKIQLDLDYIRNRSLVGDLKILARTLLLPARKLKLALWRAIGGSPPAQLAPYALLAVLILVMVGVYSAESP